MKELNESIVRTSKYWQEKEWNKAKGGVNDLPNCTCFCNGAFNWCYDAESKVQMFKGKQAGGWFNAKDWYSTWLFDKGSIPKVASIAVWDGAKSNGNCGHVAFVKSFNGNQITVYQSMYGLSYFSERTYTVAVGEVTSGLGAKFIGFCYHPYYKENEEEKKAKYISGKVYQTKVILNVRDKAGTDGKIKTYNQLTVNARKNAYPPSSKYSGKLKIGTFITCLEVKNVGNDIWLRIPSGWVCAYCNGETYIE